MILPSGGFFFYPHSPYLRGIINHKSIKMKKLLFTLFLTVCMSTQAQIGYWTAYQFDVNPGSEELVLKLFNEYFSKY